MLQFLAVVTLVVSAAHGQGCPEKKGVQTYPNEEYCDQFYKVSKGSACNSVPTSSRICIELSCH